MVLDKAQLNFTEALQTKIPMANSIYKIYFKLSLPFFYVLSFLFFIPNLLQSQHDLPVAMERYDFQNDSIRLDQLKQIYGNNKVIPVSIKQQVLVALSHYPELVDVPIEFILKKARVAHTSSIVIKTIFRKKKSRRYKIIISTAVSEMLSPGLHQRLSYNAKIGVIGHELGHTLYYKDKSGLQIIGFAIKYLSKKFGKKIENETDRIAITHNLGYQLLEWSREAHDALEEAGRGENYLTPEQILEELNEGGL